MYNSVLYFQESERKATLYIHGLLFTRLAYANVFTGKLFMLCKNTVSYQNIFTNSCGFGELQSFVLVKTRAEPSLDIFSSFPEAA